MGQSYPLTIEEIEKNIEPNRIGNYAYGYLNDKGSFIVKYVGRSDTNLQERIQHGIIDNSNNPNLRYERFKFSYANSLKEAYEKECRNYHDFGGDKGHLCNLHHPDSPDGLDLDCPFCK